MEKWRAFVGGKWRVVEAPRRIIKGRNAGRIEVVVKEISQPKDGPWRWVERRKIVNDVKKI